MKGRIKEDRQRRLVENKNYIKCKWIKHAVKKAEILRLDKKARPKPMLFRRYTLKIQRHKPVKVKGRKKMPRKY